MSKFVIPNQILGDVDAAQKNILPANTARKYLYLCNISDVVLYGKFGADAVSGEGIALPINVPIIFDRATYIPTAAFNAISSSGNNKALLVVEGY